MVYLHDSTLAELLFYFCEKACFVFGGSESFLFMFIHTVGTQGRRHGVHNTQMIKHSSSYIHIHT
jgi:hypothetical protein